ncbi:MAG: SGNH/GDSL hydrolase family protein [Myxococcota bacterium]
MRRFFVGGAVLPALLLGCTNEPSESAGTEAASSGSTAAATSMAMTTVAPTPTSDTSSPPSDTAADSTSGGGSSDGVDPTTGEPPAEPAVRWVGRYDRSDPSRTRFSWSGAGFVVRFEGAGVTARMDDPAARFFTVVVDGAVQPTLATTPGEQDYVLASGLAAGEHTVELYRRTEGNVGPSEVLSVDIDGELLAPPPVSRRVEIIGDSITCGYGNEGEAPCSFTLDTENHYLTYGAIAARDVGAELSTVAWSGKGVIYNYGDNVDQPLPDVYDRRIATEEAPWDYGWQPDVVVINLGTNDFSTDGDPTQEIFVGAYVDFVTHIRDVNPDAYILLLSPSLFGAEVAVVDGYLQDVVDVRTNAGDPAIGWANINVEWIGSGCDGHPSLATHEGMAANLANELEMRLGW